MDPCWESEPICVPLFAGASVTIQIFPEGETDEHILSEDESDVLGRFLSLPQTRSDEIVPHLWQYYQDIRARVDPDEIVNIPDPADIWKHVQPRSVSVNRDERGVPYIDIEANCDWEPEHGLQLVLQNGTRWVRVSDYSGHLTDGRAYGKRFLDDWIADPSKTLPVRSLDELLAA